MIGFAMKHDIPPSENSKTATLTTPAGTSSSSSVRATACQEVEVKGRDTGTLGGVGKHCSSMATQFCSTCSKMVCDAHYNLIHSIHDLFISGKNSSRTDH